MGKKAITVENVKLINRFNIKHLFSLQKTEESYIQWMMGYKRLLKNNDINTKYNIDLREWQTALGAHEQSLAVLAEETSEKNEEAIQQ